MHCTEKLNKRKDGFQLTQNEKQIEQDESVCVFGGWGALDIILMYLPSANLQQNSSWCYTKKESPKQRPIFTTVWNQLIQVLWWNQQIALIIHFDAASHPEQHIGGREQRHKHLIGPNDSIGRVTKTQSSMITIISNPNMKHRACRNCSIRQCAQCVLY